MIKCYNRCANFLKQRGYTYMTIKNDFNVLITRLTIMKYLSCHKRIKYVNVKHCILIFKIFLTW